MAARGGQRRPDADPTASTQPPVSAEPGSLDELFREVEGLDLAEDDTRKALRALIRKIERYQVRLGAAHQQAVAALQSLDPAAPEPSDVEHPRAPEPVPSEPRHSAPTRVAREIPYDDVATLEAQLEGRARVLRLLFIVVAVIFVLVIAGALLAGLVLAPNALDNLFDPVTGPS